MFTDTINRYDGIQFFDTLNEMREFQHEKKLMLDEDQFLPEKVTIINRETKVKRCYRIVYYLKYVFFMEVGEYNRWKGVEQ